VFEASDAVGGMARSLELWGQKVDLGPHRFFSSDARVNRLWLEVVGRSYRMVDRLTRIYYRRRFFDYPLRPRNALLNMGLGNAVICLASYLREQVSARGGRPDGGDSFESWVISRFGRRLYEMFFESYSEKLWGVPCSELDADFAAQRIKKFSLGEAVKGALGLGGRHHRTLVDRFAYPLEGTGAVYEGMASAVSRQGGRVLLDHRIAGVVTDGKRVTSVLSEKEGVLAYDHVVSTMPLTMLVRSLGVLPPDVEQAIGTLRYRNTVLVFLRVSGSGLFPDQWLYVHSPELQMGRVTNFSNWVDTLCPDPTHTVLALEYWCYDEDQLWLEGDALLVERARQEIARTGLVAEQSVKDGQVVRLPWSYPVYSRGYKQPLAVVASFLKTFQGIIAIGRYGAFKYNNQDHSILMGLLAAENLAQGAAHDLWQVNTDYEAYQEAAVITETGLVEKPGG
ncbi:MAG: hypothetical protein FJ125_12020, partial [Deltaproteobacteria bacterium]|nr:hypothetical protein [Deltaproteobacteria bacterium]